MTDLHAAAAEHLAAVRAMAALCDSRDAAPDPAWYAAALREEAAEAALTAALAAEAADRADLLADLQAIQVTVELIDPSGTQELAATQVAALIERLGDQPTP